MLTRIITSVIGMAIVVPVLIFSDTVALPLFMCLLSVLAVYELLKCMDKLKNKALTVFSFLFSVFVPIFCRFDDVFKTDYFSDRVVQGMLAAALIFFFVCVACSIFSKGRYDIFETLSATALIIYIVGGLSSVILLRDLEHGQYLYILVFLTAWGSDIFAYFVGVFFGKHKLIPDVSPKKTIEGSIGGVFGNILCFAVYAFVISRYTASAPNYPALVFAAIITSVISQIGDLFMSLIKRRYGIKDFGKLLPGHGGVLDRFDSFIAAAPFLFLLCTSSEFFQIFLR